MGSLPFSCVHVSVPFHTSVPFSEHALTLDSPSGLRISIYNQSHLSCYCPLATDRTDLSPTWIVSHWQPPTLSVALVVPPWVIRATYNINIDRQEHLPALAHL